MLYKATKTVDEQYIVELAPVTKAKFIPTAVGLDAFWLNDTNASPVRTVQYDTNDETIFVVVELTKDGKYKIYDGDINDMKADDDYEPITVQVVENDEETAELVYIYKTEKDTTEKAEKPGDCMVGFWQASASGNVCFAFYDKEGKNLTQRQLLDLDLKAEDFTITINGKSYTGKTMTNISNDSGVNKTALKVNFGTANTVFVPGDQYQIGADGKELESNNIEFSFSIKGINYTLESGSIVIA